MFLMKLSPVASRRFTAAGAEQSEQLLTVLYSEALIMLFDLKSPGSEFTGALAQREQN